jgi:uncharacterized protein YbcI
MAATKSSPSTMEAEAATAVARFQHEHHGHFPEHVRAMLVEDLLIVRCSGTFNRHEHELRASKEGQKLIQSARREMQTDLRHELHALIEEIVSCRVVRSFYDIDVRSGDEARVFVLDRQADPDRDGRPGVL